MKTKNIFKILRKYFLLNDKKALSMHGHKIFAVLLALIVIYILKNYISISFTFILLHAPVYIIGSVFPDILHRTGQSRIAHRFGILHRKFSYYVLGGLSPLIIYYAIISQKYYFWQIPFNQYTLIQSFIFGILTHGFGDSLTSKLK